MHLLSKSLKHLVTCFSCSGRSTVNLNSLNIERVFLLILAFFKTRHIPKAKATTVVETPEMRRLAENTKLQSQVHINNG
jgi:hypothetical protein